MCVTVLEDGLRLLDPELSYIDQLLRILSGSHALLLYAIDFWLEHVLACTSVGHLPKQSSLVQALSSLNLLHNRLQSILKPSALSEAIPHAPASTDSRLEALSHLSVYPLCAYILTFREGSKEKSASNGQGKFVLFSSPVASLKCCWDIELLSNELTSTLQSSRSSR